MKKITIIALHLGYGGIEKAIVTLANNLSSKYDVEIVSTYKLYDDVPYKLNDDIDVKYLSNFKPNKEEFKKNLKSFHIIKTFISGMRSLKILYLKKHLMINFVKNCSSDVIISTRIYHNKILQKYKKRSVLGIAWEHNHHNNDKRYINNIVKSTKNLDYLVLVSKELFNDYSKYLNGYNCKCAYIPNMIENSNYTLSNLNTKKLITVSRLSKEKGLFDLIDTFSLIKNQDLTLSIIGDGNLKDKLREYINFNKLDKRVTLLGFQNSNNVHKYLADASLYVMTSYTESFGIALLEAFCHGVPAVAFDSAQGANEIITDNINGKLIKKRNKKMMAEFIDKYFSDEDVRKKLSKNSLKSIEQFKENNVIKYWFDLIK